MMNEKDFSPLFTVPLKTSFIKGTSVELIQRNRPARPPEHVLFDFDGTLSLIREGWMEIMVPMMRDILLPYARPGETAESISLAVREFVTRLTGKQTIYQMMRLAQEINLRGGIPEDPQVYKERYHDLLMARIKGRREGLASGRLSPDQAMVPGSRQLMESLLKKGTTLYIASGTDEQYVLEEARLLGLDAYAKGRIYGAQKDVAAFSKEMVIKRILSENRVEGDRLLAFGDGYVEIADSKAAGGYAVGVASDESGRSGCPDEWKRTRLIGAGADIIVPDYRDSEALLDYIWCGRGAEGAGAEGAECEN